MDSIHDNEVEEILEVEEEVTETDDTLDEQDSKITQAANLKAVGKKTKPPMKMKEEEEEEEEEELDEGAANANPQVKAGKGKYVGLYKDGTGKGAVIPEPTDVEQPEKGESQKKLKANVAAKKAMREEIDTHMNAMFDGEELSETFRTKASTIFETALNERVQAIQTELEEEYNNRLVDEVDSIKKGLSEQLDSYLSYVVEEWMEENKIAVEKGIRTEIAEEFMSGLRGLFLEHNIQVPESKVDIADQMAEAVDGLKVQLDEEMNRNIALKAEIAEYRKAAILSEATSDLAETEKERFAVLTEDISFDDEDELRNKVQIIKESYFGGKKAVIREENFVSHEDPTDAVEGGEVPANLTESMSSYTEMISRLNRR
jgi:hypothetical protein